MTCITHLSLTRPATSTQNCVPSEVVSGGKRIKTEEVVRPPGGGQSQPACFGIGQLRISERSENDRLCSACMGLSRLNSIHWEEINNCREVVVNHHHSFDALPKSAHEGCHLCALLWIALKESCRLDQEPGGVWITKLKDVSTPLYEGTRLRFRKARLTWTVPHTDEIQITLLCGGLRGGRLICQAMGSECSSFLAHIL